MTTTHTSIMYSETLHKKYQIYLVSPYNSFKKVQGKKMIADVPSSIEKFIR